MPPPDEVVPPEEVDVGAVEPGLHISDVRMQDVRAITDLCTPLGDLTVLVGPNNVGKSTFLRALDIALGGARPTDDDLHVSEAGGRSAEFLIDLKIVPASGDEFAEAFAVRFGDAIRLPSTGRQFVTLRVRGSAGTEGSGPSLEYRFLDGWECERAAALELTELGRPNRDQLRLLSFFLLDARRDIVDELRQRQSYWGRLLADIGIDASERAALEAQLEALGSDVVTKSSVLTTLRDELDRIQEALGSAVTAVSIEAIPARINEVVRAVDVLLKAPGSAALPLRLQGMGSRSLAVVMVFQAFTRLRLGADQDIRPLSVAAFEEPEAHLHPHPQRAMFDLIRRLPGQKIVSTHSPYVVQVADLFDVRALARSGGSIVSRLVSRTKPDGTPTFTEEGLAKARRFVQRNNGEVLFARCVILFEGDTEDGALPVFARARWGADPTVHGVSVVDAQGAGNFKHFVPVLDSLGIPWVVLVDGDAGGQGAIAALETQLGRSTTGDEVFSMPNGMNLEQHLIAGGYQDEIRAAIKRLHGPMALDDYRTVKHGQKKSATVVRDYQSAGWEDRLLEDYCHGMMRTALGGATIAEEILAAVEAGVKPAIPAVVEGLLRRVDAIIGVGP